MFGALVCDTWCCFFFANHLLIWCKLDVLLLTRRAVLLYFPLSEVATCPMLSTVSEFVVYSTTVWKYFKNVKHGSVGRHEEMSLCCTVECNLHYYCQIYLNIWRQSSAFIVLVYFSSVDASGESEQLQTTVCVHKAWTQLDLFSHGVQLCCCSYLFM